MSGRSKTSAYSTFAGVVVLQFEVYSDSALCLTLLISNLPATVLWSSDLYFVITPIDETLYLNPDLLINNQLLGNRTNAVAELMKWWSVEACTVG